MKWGEGLTRKELETLEQQGLRDGGKDSVARDGEEDSSLENQRVKDLETSPACRKLAP